MRGGPRRRGGQGRRVAAVAVAAATLLAGCAGGHAAPAGRSPVATASNLPDLLLTRQVLTVLSADPAVAAGLRRARVYEVLRPAQPPAAGLPGVPAVTFSSVTELAAALRGHALPAGTGAVVYDPEAWSLTPAAEQRHPAGAAARAAALAHAAGLQLIVAPALDLTTVLAAAGPTAEAVAGHARAPGVGPRWQQFLALRLAAALGRYADVIDLQAQSLERDQAAYAAFVRQAARQARAAHPGITVLAGLSTNPPGAPVSARQLTAAITQTRAWVSGYWLNVPGQGPRCPTCGPSRPDLARQVVREIL
jgi:hypothetical protein